MRKPKTEAPANGRARGPEFMPPTRDIPLARIEEPDLPSRESIDSDALDELVESMAEIGLIEPIAVCETKTGYQVISGHRRLLAARRLHWPAIRASIYPDGYRAKDAVMLHENVIREQLNPAHEAIWFNQLIERRGLDTDGLAALVHRTRAYVENRLNLVRGDERIFEAVRNGAIPLGVGEILNRFETTALKRYYLDQAIRSGTSARVVRTWFDEHNQSLAAAVEAGTAAGLDAQAEPAPSTPMRCFLCQGSVDPWNLQNVFIHTWELAQLREMIDRASAVLRERFESGGGDQAAAARGTGESEP